MSDEIVIPESPGKGEAQRTFLARGGGLNALGRYRTGPMKGMTLGQAQSLFEDHWAQSSGSLKDKYARRAGDDREVLSPWERRKQGLDRTETASEMYARQRKSRMDQQARINGTKKPATQTPAQPAYDKDRNGVPDMVQKPSQSVPSMLARPKDSAVVSASRPAWRGTSGNVGTSAPAKAVTPGVQPLSSLARNEIAKRKAAVGGTPTGRMTISDKDAATASKATGARVNPVTGLPFGHMPGDSLPVGADPAMLNRADQSVKRQQIQASKAAIGQDVSGAPKAKIATRPAFRSALDDPSNAFSKAAYRRTDAAIAKGEANVKRRAEESAEWNSPANTKTRMKEEGAMFTGRVKPVDQLVRERGTPSAGVGKSMPSSRPSFARARR